MTLLVLNNWAMMFMHFENVLQKAHDNSFIFSSPDRSSEKAIALLPVLSAARGQRQRGSQNVNVFTLRFFMGWARC